MNRKIRYRRLGRYGHRNGVNQGWGAKMRVRDLGRIEGPVLVFGGVYSNAQALEALMRVARDDLGLPSERMICTGDIAGYCAGAFDCVDRVMRAGLAVVAGNVERQLGSGADDCGCGFAAGTTCDLLSGAWYAHAASEVSETQRAWMRDLPDVVTFHHEGARHAVLHGGASDIARFVWPDAPGDIFDAEWRMLEAAIGPVDRVIAGHCGLAFRRETARGPWINAGAIGLPPHDGAPETRFCVLQGGQATFHRLAYDHDAAARAMVASGLTQGYHAALSSGYWPSEDVLPPSLRRPVLASG